MNLLALMTEKVEEKHLARYILMSAWEMESRERFNKVLKQFKECVKSQEIIEGNYHGHNISFYSSNDLRIDKRIGKIDKRFNNINRFMYSENINNKTVSARNCCHGYREYEYQATTVHDESVYNILMEKEHPEYRVIYSMRCPNLYR